SQLLHLYTPNSTEYERAMYFFHFLDKNVMGLLARQATALPYALKDATLAQFLWDETSKQYDVLQNTSRLDGKNGPPNFESTIIAIYAALWNAEYQCRWNKWDFAVKSLDKATEILDNLEEGEEKDVMALDIMSARTL